MAFGFLLEDQGPTPVAHVGLHELLDRVVWSLLHVLVLRMAEADAVVEEPGIRACSCTSKEAFKMMAFWALLNGLGKFFNILLGARSCGTSNRHQAFSCGARELGRTQDSIPM